MRRRLAPFVAVLLTLSALAAGCGGSSGGDPYELVFSSSKTTWDPVQVNFGFAAKDGSTTVAIDPSSIGFVIDAAGGTGAIHVAIPASDLDLDSALLAQLGITGDSIDLDVVWDGDGVYGRSPILAMAVELLLAESGEMPSGDLTGWLRLASAADLDGLGDLLGDTGTLPLPSIPVAGDAKTLKTELEDLGITLSNAGSEQHNGTDANHIKATLDKEKLLASEAFESVSAAETGQVREALEELEVALDLWIETSTKHLIEVAVTLTSTTNADQSAEIVVRFDDPDGSIATEAPADFVELPVDALITNLMELVGQGLTGG